jgi:hypothetical protein
MKNIGHGRRWTSVCSCIESILKIRDPLKSLYEEGAFDSTFQGQIPTDEMFHSMSVLAGPLKIIKAASYKVQMDSKTTVQHAINLIIELGHLSTVEAAT